VYISLHLLALALAAGADPAAQLDAGLTRHAAGPERAVWASSLLVGTPYVPSPLGDLQGPRVGTRFRLDAFDCVTFVETVIALGNSASTSEAARLLDDVRYDGTADYAHRNHYVEAQWVPVNVGKGWIAEATRAMAGPLAQTATKHLTPATWRAAERARHVLADLPPGRRPLGSFSLDLVPLGHVAEVAPRIPDGTLLFVLREDRPWRPYRVTHAGIVVTGRRGERYLRHASDVPGVLRVRDEPLEKFLARNARYRDWPVSGVSLFTIRDNSARVHRLEAPSPKAGEKMSAH
jgi:hypothetical protein